MEFSAELTRTIQDLVSLPSPWAIHKLRYLAQLPPFARDQAWEAVWASAPPPRRAGLVAELNYLVNDPNRCRAVLNSETVPPEFGHWLAKYEHTFRENIGEYGVPEEISAAMYPLSARQITLSTIPGGAPLQSCRQLIEDIRSARKQFMARDGTGRFTVLLATSLNNLGILLVNEKDYAGAIPVFEEATALANECRNLPQLIIACQHLVSIHSQGGRDIRGALQRILPLWSDYHRGPPSFHLARMADMLAFAYLRAADLHETKYFLTQTEELLAASGFPLSMDVELTTTLLRWAELAPDNYVEDMTYYETFLMALGVWNNHTGIRQSIASDPVAYQALGEWMNNIRQAQHLLLNTANERTRRDGELMRRLGTEFYVQPLDQDYVDLSAARQATLSIDERLKTGPYDEQLLRDIQAEAARPETRKVARYRMNNFWRLAAWYQGAGKPKTASRLYRQGQHLAEESGELGEVLYAIRQRVGLVPAEEPERKLSLCLDGIQRVEARRRNVVTPYQQSAFFNGRTEVYQMGIAWARYLERWDLMLGLGDLIKARNFSLPEVSPAVMLTLREGLAGHYAELSTATGAERLKLLRARQLFYDNWLLANAGTAGRWRTEIPVPELQSALKKGEAALSYYQVNAEVWFAILITPQELVHTAIVVQPEEFTARLEALTKLGELGANYRARGAEAFIPKKKGKVPSTARRSPQQALKELGEYLLPAEITEGLAGADRLYICPHRQLHRVPFHVLPHKDGYLIEAFAVSYLPNLHSLLYKDAEFSCERSVAIVGSGEFITSDGTRLVNLDGARTEVEELAAYYRGRGLRVLHFIDGRANRSAILTTAEADGFADCDVIQIALHGEDVPTDTPLDARLFVRDGSIDGFDISHWRLSAELVILSACYAGVRAVSGRGLAYLPGDDVFGLQAAFFSAGARRVFGALWPVADAAGKELMLGFHRNLAVLPPARAWQKTVVDLLADGPEAWRGVQFWGAFFLAEEGREGSGTSE